MSSSAKPTALNQPTVLSCEYAFRSQINYVSEDGIWRGAWTDVGQPNIDDINGLLKPRDNEFVGWVDFYRAATLTIKNAPLQVPLMARRRQNEQLVGVSKLFGPTYVSIALLSDTNEYKFETVSQIIARSRLPAFTRTWLEPFAKSDQATTSNPAHRGDEIRRLLAHTKNL